MADISTDISLEKIIAPELTSSQYGKDIRQQFENIDKNFRQVSNADFIKGTPGASVLTETLKLYENDTFTALGQAMIETITNLSIVWSVDWSGNDFTSTFYDAHPSLKPVIVVEEGTTRTVHFFDYLIQYPDITVMYTPVDVENPASDKYLISSPQVYTFLDMRYSNVKELGGITGDNDEGYESLEDQSCLLTLTYEHTVTANTVVNTPVFNRSNLFPTLYYDSTDNEFKWRIYGNETGIRAMGPVGEAGTRAAVWIVKTSAELISVAPDAVQLTSSVTVPNPDITRIEYYADINNGIMRWVAVDYNHRETIPFKAGDVCIALVPIGASEDYIADSDDSDDWTDIFDAFTSLISVYGESGHYYATVNQQNAIGQNMYLNHLINQLKGIKSGGALGGLFVPMDENGNYSNGAHYLYNIKSSAAPNQDILYVRPVQDNNPNVQRNPNTGTLANASLCAKYKKIELRGEGYTNTEGEVDLYAVKNDSGSIGIPGSIKVGCSEIDIEHEKKINITSSKINIGTTGTTNVITGGVEINGNTTVNGKINGDLNITGAVTAKVNRVSDVYLGCPIGTIVMWAGEINPHRLKFPPDGWFLCDGTEITGTWTNVFTPSDQPIQGRSCTSQELITLCNIIEGKYGSGPDRIKLPDLQQRFPLGATTGSTGRIGPDNYDTSLGKTGGEAGHKLTLNERNTNVTVENKGDISGSYNVVTSIPADPNVKAHNNIPPFLAINFIIKYR